MVFVGSSAKFVALDAGTGQEVWIIDLGTWVEISWSEVVDGMIYLGTAHGELIAVEAKTGVEQWRFVVPPPPDATPESGNRNPWIRNGAAVADGLVYFGNGEGHFYALDAATGEVRWEFDTGRTGYPNVVVMDGVAYMVTHGNVYALDAVSGSIIWHVEVDGGIWYRPVVTGDLLNVAYDRVRGKLIGIDRDTGETRWTFAYSDDPELTYEFPEMHVRGGTLYTGSTGQGLFALDAASGAFLWRVEKP
jgi:outer membrane protein assembly factor BamB